MREVRRRDHALAAALAQRLDEPLAAQRVELGGHVVEQHQRSGATLLRQHAALGEQQREQPEALLAARPVGAQLAAGALEHQLVAVRPVAGEAAVEVASRCARPARRPAPPRSRRASAAGRSARRRPRARAPRRGSRTAPPAATRPRRGRRPGRRRGARARDPRRGASSARRGRRGSRPAARCAGRAPPCRRGACRRGPATARRSPGRRARAAAPGRPSTSSSRSGRKTETSGRALASVSLSTVAPSTCSRFASPGSKPDGDPVRVAVALGVELQPRDAGAEAHDLALVAGPARAAGAGEVDRLEQVRLAGPVRARDHGQPRAQPHLRRLVGAEVADGEAGDPHGDRLPRAGIRPAPLTGTCAIRAHD